MPPVPADLIEKLVQIEPKARLGGAWSEEADALDPIILKGPKLLEPRTLGHAALRAHPFFDGLPATELYKVRVTNRSSLLSRTNQRPCNHTAAPSASALLQCPSTLSLSL